MKKCFLLLLLATACNRAPEKFERLAGKDAEGQISLDELAPFRRPDDVTPPTARERAEYQAQMTLAARANNTDSVTVTTRDRNTGQFVQRREAVEREPEAEDAMEAGDTSLDCAYTVVAHASRERFMRRVNEHLNDGYFLRGSMRTERTGPGSFVYLQDMVRHRAGVE